MSRETVYLDVKSDIKSVTKDQEKYNKELKETKTNIKDVNKEGKEVVAEMQILGLSLNGLKTSFNTAAKGAKFLFATVKRGIIATGVGAFIVALGTLFTWFTTTKKGAEALEKVMAGVGAAINVVIDRVAQIGGGLAKILSGDIRGGLKEIGDSFKNIGEEVKTDTLLNIAYADSIQKVRDKERELRIETSKQRAEVERLKLIAEDVTKSQGERLDAAQKAFDIENDLVTKRVKNAEDELRLEKSKIDLTTASEEDLNRLADLEVRVNDIRAESTTKQIELNNKLNAIKQEGAAKEIEDLNELKALDKERTGDLQMMPRITQETNDQIIQSNDEFTEKYLKDLDDRKKAEEGLEDFKIFAANQAVEITKTLMATEVQEVEEAYQREIELAGGNKDAQDKINKKFEKKRAALAKKQKAFDIAQATVDTFKAANAAYNSMAGIPIVGQVLAPIAAGLAVAAGLANVRKIAKQDTGGGAGGGGGGGGGGMPGGTPAPDMQSGKFELTPPAQEQDAVRAFVVTDDVTQGQDKLSTIRRNAVI